MKQHKQKSSLALKASEDFYFALCSGVEGFLYLFHPDMGIAVQLYLPDYFLNLCSVLGKQHCSPLLTQYN